MFVMLILAIAFSLVARNLLGGWFYQVLFFLLGAAIPIIDVPYVKYLHNSYCEGNIGLQVYKEIEPQDHFYIESSSRIYIYDFFSKKIKFIEHYDLRKQELWKVTKVDNELVKESIEEAASIYQYVSQGQTYTLDNGIEKVVSRQIVKRSSSDVVAEFITYTNTKFLGWFFSQYYGTTGKSCQLDEISGKIIMRLRNLLVNGTEFGSLNEIKR
jgi:hypothetical protein